MLRRLGRVIAIGLLVLGGGFVAGSASAAVPAAIDPQCEIYGTGGVLQILDPSEAPAGLPAPVTLDDLGCILVNGPQLQYAYFGDAYAKFLELANGFAADGWTLNEELDDNATVPVDLAELASRTSDPDIALSAQRGDGFAGILFVDGDGADFAPIAIVIAAPVAAVPTPTESGTGLDDPSTISNLRTIGDAVPSPGQGAVLVVSAGLLTLLIAIPAFLVSKVLVSRYQQWFGWLERGRIGRIRKRLAEPGNAGRRWLILAVGMVLASVIAGFVDPRFGFNGLSLRLFFTLLATFALFNVGGWAVVTLVLKRLQPDAKPTLTFHPASILVVAVAVLLSRLLGFDPGIIFGLVAGTTFAVALAKSREAAVIIAGSAYAAAVALVAWIVYSVMNSGGPPENGFLVAISEFLGGVTLEGVSTLPIALIPLATLDGGILFAWRKWVWAVCYVVGLALFMLVLFNLPGGDTPVDGGFVRWVVVFAVFAVIAVGIWLADLLVRRRAPVAAPEV